MVGAADVLERTHFSWQWTISSKKNIAKRSGYRPMDVDISYHWYFQLLFLITHKEKMRYNKNRKFYHAKKIPLGMCHLMENRHLGADLDELAPWYRFPEDPINGLFDFSRRFSHEIWLGRKLEFFGIEGPLLVIIQLRVLWQFTVTMTFRPQTVYQLL